MSTGFRCTDVSPERTVAGKIETSMHAPLPFDNCPALDGYNSQTNSLAKIFTFNGMPLEEEILLGLGAGLGFTYRHPKNGCSAIIGRGNIRSFFEDTGERTGVAIVRKSTSSSKKAEQRMIERLRSREPVMIFADPALLPWRRRTTSRHSDGHTIIVCGYDGDTTVLASDIDDDAPGLGKGFYHTISLDDISRARASENRPHPPGNSWLEFDFNHPHVPEALDFTGSIRRNATTMLHPPASNSGIRGIRRMSHELRGWTRLFDEESIRPALVNLAYSIEVDGTGGGLFRKMYSRFLTVASRMVFRRILEKAAAMFDDSGHHFSRIAALLLDMESTRETGEIIDETSLILQEIADIEENAFIQLMEKLPAEE
jgi:hypothetical protein